MVYDEPEHAKWLIGSEITDDGMVWYAVTKWRVRTDTFRFTDFLTYLIANWRTGLGAYLLITISEGCDPVNRLYIAPTGRIQHQTAHACVNSWHYALLYSSPLSFIRSSSLTHTIMLYSICWILHRSGNWPRYCHQGRTCVSMRGYMKLTLAGRWLITLMPNTATLPTTALCMYIPPFLTELCIDAVVGGGSVLWLIFISIVHCQCKNDVFHFLIYNFSERAAFVRNIDIMMTMSFACNYLLHF